VTGLPNPGLRTTDSRLPSSGRVLPRLYAIVDVDVCERAGWTPRDLCRAYLAGGARLFQLRAKAMASGPLLDLASAMREDVAAADGMLIVNDRADLALLADASGVHVGQEDLPAEDARRIVGADRLVGLSTHTDAQIRAALDALISYLAVGPMFETTTKDTGYAARGTSLLRAAVAASGTARRAVPIVAIGGITLERAPELIDAGAASVAVISDLMTGDPEARARQFVELLEGRRL
jgi:thiamine-phosphate pyrophosphorylase